MRLLTGALLSMVAAAGLSGADSMQVVSPDGAVRLTFSAAPERLSYRVDYKGQPLLLDSELRLSLLEGPFEVRARRRSRNRSTWRPVYGQRREIPDNYGELRVDVGTPDNPDLLVRLSFRAYDEGVAWRYTVLRPARITAMDERTEFRFPPDTLAWEEHGTEGPYQRVPVTRIKAKCERPLTLEYPDGIFASLTEAATVDYPRMLLSPLDGVPGALYSDLDGPVTGAAPFDTPWRVLVVGERPGDLTERSYLVLNLNPPNALANTSWIKPGKAMREVTLSTAGGKETVDFAVKHGIDYIEYDAGWYGHEYDEQQNATTVTPDPKRTGKIANWSGLDLPEVIRYASERGIGVFLYVNRRQLERQLDEILPLYERWGVKGVKFGFVHVGEQRWTRWLHEAVRQAAAHRLMVDIHDAYRPTGYSRTYPNLLTQEGIRGNEHMPTADHNVTLPFTRYVAGAGDYTICYYTPRLKTTRAHQLAMSVIAYSPLQFLFWYDRPSAYKGEREVEFFRRLPTTWDESRVLDGVIGQHVILARRKGAEWFIGAATNSESRELELPLDFLPEGSIYTARIYRDGPTPKAVLIETRHVSRRDQLQLRLAASGGQAIRVTPLR